MFESKVNKGKANGYVPLEANSKISPSYIDTASLGIGGFNQLPYVFGIPITSGSFSINSSNLANVTEIQLNAVNSYGIDMTSWYDEVQNTIEEDSQQIYLDLINTTDASKNARFKVNEYDRLDTYRGFSAFYNRTYAADPSINRVFVYLTGSEDTVEISNPGNTEDDVFALTGLDNSGVYGYFVYFAARDENYPEFNDEPPIPLTNLKQVTQYVIDNAFYSGSELATIEQMTSSYLEILPNLHTFLPSLYDNFEFSFYEYAEIYANESYSSLTASYTNGSGTNVNSLSFSFTSYVDNSAVITSQGGGLLTGYAVGDLIYVPLDGSYYLYEDSFIPSTLTGSAILEVTAVVEGYPGAIKYVSGIPNLLTEVVGPAIPRNNIQDGGSDQYDTGNYINNELFEDIEYISGSLEADTFGAGSQYSMFYSGSIFAMIVSGSTVNTFYLGGGLGSDGNGFNDSAKLKMSSTTDPITLSVENYFGNANVDTGSLDEYSLAVNAEYISTVIGSKGGNIYSIIPRAANGVDLTDAENNIFLGSLAGASTEVRRSNFFGNSAGNLATNANSSNFLGEEAGYSASNAYGSNFFGSDAGRRSSEAYESNFLGGSAGEFATNANNSNFLGRQAGDQATNANNSNFLGDRAGSEATNANNSNFLGRDAGYQATNANNSNFLGYYAGRTAVGASYSTLIGYQVGLNAGYNVPGIGSNNIIIGTNITLPQGSQDSINLGGIIFATGSHSNVSTYPPFSGSVGGRVGINVVSPTEELEVNGTVQISEVLVLPPQDPLPAGAPQGSFAVSGSGVDCKPYFWNGSTWTALF